MKINQIQYFLTVAETGSFTEAAYELYVSQSSLSKQIIALEKELGFALFDRSHRRVALTEAGQSFAQHAHQLNAAYLAMMADVGAFKTNTAVAILSLPFIAQYGITTWLARFQQAYPHFEYTLVEREPLPILRALDNHSFDLAFVRDNYLDVSRYDSLLIAKDQLLLAVSKEHRFADRQSVSLRELTGENFILYDQSTLMDKVVVDACHEVGYDPHVVFSSLRVDSILSLVAPNNGVSVLMSKVFSHSRHHGVVGIPLEETINTNVILAWLKDSKLSWPARTFVDYMRTTLAEHSG